MVVPYLRNPRRHRNTPVAIKTKSQYHLEPDHATTFDEASTYKHVGRRTKGGSGGGYLYSSSSSSYNSNGNTNYKSSGDGGKVGEVVGYIALGIFGLILGAIVLGGICACFVDLFRTTKKFFRRVKERHQRQEAIRQLEQQARQQQQEAQESDANVWHLRLSGGRPGDIESPNGGDPSAPHIATIQEYASRNQNATEETSIELIVAQLNRKRLIRSKLDYQVVLPDKSNVTAQSIRSSSNNTDPKADDATEASDDDSIIDSDETKRLSGKKPAAEENISGSSSTIYFTLRNLLSFRRPIKQEDCSICLECFAPCQTICVAKNSCCNHVFHEECIESWLMEHDHCPNCRSNMME